MSEWITTGRLPTGDDADIYGDVWHSGSGCVGTLSWYNVTVDDIWQPKQKRPSPYVHPKSRDELVQELLDVIDSSPGMGKFASWKLEVLEAREKLR